MAVRGAQLSYGARRVSRGRFRVGGYRAFQPEFMDGRPRSSATVLSQAVRTIGASAGGAAPPNILLSRSMDQVGRKSETTLGIAGLHFEIGTFPGAAPDQFDLPSGASNAGNRQRGCGERADPPAGDGRRRLSEAGGLGLAAPAMDGDADGAGTFGGKLKTAGGGHGEPRDLGNNGGQPAMPQTLLETGKHSLFVARFDINHAVGQKPGLRDGRANRSGRVMHHKTF